MTKFSRKMQEISSIARLHANWLLFAILGEEAISATELADLHTYGKLPMDKQLSFSSRAYLLGKLKIKSKASDYRQTESIEVQDTGDVGQDTALARNTKEFRALTSQVQKIVATGLSEALQGSLLSGSTGIASKLLSSIKERLEKLDWRSVAETELVASKNIGAAQAIISQEGILAGGDGPDSRVSVVPGKNCCKDCFLLFTDNGAPKVFQLKELLPSYSNTVHTKTKGVHTNWKPTLPPLHNNCGCQLVYIPPGHDWVNGKLSLINKSLFSESIIKATAGVSGGIASTVKPSGPVGSKKEPGTPSVPGAAAPGNIAGPGRPSGTMPKPGKGTPGGAGGGPQLMPCPFGGGAECFKHGGNGAENHEANSEAMKNHQKAMARGAEPTTPEAKEAKTKAAEQHSRKQQGVPKAPEVVIKHLSEGKIAGSKQIGGNVFAVNQSHRIDIEGNGSGLMKDSHLDYSGFVKDHETLSKEEVDAKLYSVAAPGAGTMPSGSSASAEVAAYQVSNSLGMGSLFPVTTHRTHDGSNDIERGAKSVQSWNWNAVDTDAYITAQVKGGGRLVKGIINSAPPEHREKIKEQLANVAVMDVVFNNGDRHEGNLMVDSEAHNVVPIDHGTAFGNGMSGSRNAVARSIYSAGEGLTIPPALHQQLSNKSLDEISRSMEGSGIHDWAAGQTYLRAQYALHLQEKFGHIPFDRIRSTMTSPSGYVEPILEGWKDKVSYPSGEASTEVKNKQVEAKALGAFFKDEADQALPHDRFEQFSKSWLQKASSDPSHPKHEDAKKLMQTMPLRSQAHATNQVKATPENLKSHFDSIKEYDLDNPPKGGEGYDDVKPWKWENSSPLRESPEMELGEEDIQELSPNAVSPAAYSQTVPKELPYAKTAAKEKMSLDMSEFEEKDLDQEVSAAFNNIRSPEKATVPRKSVKKSLWLRLDAKFPLT
jgi:hypothetical protein